MLIKRNPSAAVISDVGASIKITRKFTDAVPNVDTFVALETGVVLSVVTSEICL